MRTAALPFVNYPEVGNRLRAILEERKVTQQELADRTGVKQANISRFVNSGVGLSPELITRIAAELDVDVHKLYGVAPV